MKQKVVQLPYLGFVEATREALLSVYADSLDRGDFSGVSSVLSHAEQDPELEQMILDFHQVTDTQFTWQ